MKKKSIRLWFFSISFLIVCCILLARPVQVAAADSGNCGMDLKWKLTNDGILTISGTGTMWDFLPSNPAPWHHYREQIREVVVEEGVKRLGNYAFYSSPSLKKVTLPASIESMGVSAFEDCSSFELVNIPDLQSWCRIRFTSFKQNPLYYGGTLCVKGQPVTELIIPNGVSKLCYAAFAGCDSITSVTIPDSVTCIEGCVFYKCSNLADVALSGSITSIGEHAFYNCTRITDLTIPDGVTRLEESAFGNCSNLASIAIADSVNYFGPYAFVNCTALTSVHIPEGITDIYVGTFANCSSLQNIVIPNGVRTIGDITDSYSNGAFQGCTALIRISIPDSVREIGYGSFYGCTALKDVTIGNGVTAIGPRAFYDCQNLTNLTIGSNVHTICEWAFYHCNMKEITFPNSLKTIEENAFTSCWNLTSLTIPDCVTSIGESAFEYCTGLIRVTIPGSITSFGERAFSGCSKLTDVTLGYGIYGISSRAFENCKSLTCVRFPDSVRYINDYAFSGCVNLSSVWIPESVEAIRYAAFGGCVNLWHVLCEGSYSSWRWTVTIQIGNTALVDAQWHYDCTGDELTVEQTKAYTCTEGATFCHNCALCGESNTVTTPASHKWENATCIQPKTCRICGITQGEPLGESKHVWNSGTVTKWPTCIAEGTRIHICSVCGKTKTESIAPTGVHTYSSWTKTDDATHKRTCTVCHEEDTTSHTWDSGVITAHPTCTQEGSKTRTCLWCGAAKEEALPATGHNYNYVWTDATCTQAGYGTYTCVACGDSYVEYYGNPRGHTEVTDEAVPATCTQPGLTEGKHCSVCHEILLPQAEVPATGHSYTGITTEPTCTQQGYTAYTCATCGHGYTDDYIDAVGHRYTASTTAPTCTQQGYTTYTCSACSDTYTGDYTDAYGHTQTVNAAVPATCTQPGLTEGIHCSVCHEILLSQAEIPATGHSYTGITTEPTCTQQGYTVYTCSSCGDSYTGNFTDATGHIAGPQATCTTSQTCIVCHYLLSVATGHTDANADYVCDVCHVELCTNHIEQVIPGIAPGCQQDGFSEGKKCSICGEILQPQEIIPATGHEWLEATCTEPQKCFRCGIISGDPLGHDYGQWTQVTAPTEEHTGLEERVCGSCSHKEQRELEKLEPAPTDPPPTEPLPTEPLPSNPALETNPTPTLPASTEKPSENPQPVGKDNTIVIAIIAVIGGIGIGGVATLMILKKKK